MSPHDTRTFVLGRRRGRTPRRRYTDTPAMQGCGTDTKAVLRGNARKAVAA